MSNNPGSEDSTQRAASNRVAPKRPLSKMEKEARRRRIIEVVIVVVIIAVVSVVSVGFYLNNIKPWHEPIVKINDKVYDMSYFEKMLRLYGAGSDTSQDVQTAYTIVDQIRDNELVRQKAEEFGIIITDEEIEEELRSQAGYDPENETLDEFNKRVEDALRENVELSVSDFKQLSIEPILLQRKVQEALGSAEYPVDSLYNHARIKAILVGTEDDASDVKDRWSEGIDALLEDYSSSHYYPKDSVEWLPRDIESSSTLEDYIFDDAHIGIVSDPVQDTTYWTQGGYWLIMVLDTEGEEEEETLHIQGILLDSSETANEVKADIDAGGDFAEIAELNSLHSTSKDNGGDMDYMSLEEIESLFGEELLDDIQALELDTLSDPIYYDDADKQSGYWIIEVFEREDRALSEDHREAWESVLYSDWLEGEQNSEENVVVNYLDEEGGYEKILWALEQISA